MYNVQSCCYYTILDLSKKRECIRRQTSPQPYVHTKGNESAPNRPPAMIQLLPAQTSTPTISMFNGTPYGTVPCPSEVCMPWARTRYKHVKRGWPQLLRIWIFTLGKAVGGSFWGDKWIMPRAAFLPNLLSPSHLLSTLRDTHTCRWKV